MVSNCRLIQILVVLTLIRNHTLLVCFGGMSDKFGRSMVHILASFSQAKIPLERPHRFCIHQVLNAYRSCMHESMPKKVYHNSNNYILAIPKFSQVTMK